MSRPEAPLRAVRKPEEAPPARIERLARLPLFFGLANRRVLLVGGDEAALWKAELLLATGAHLDVVAAEVCDGFAALAPPDDCGALAIKRRSWRETDLTGAVLAIAAIEDAEEAAAFASAARSAGVPVNVVDKPDFCDFAFGSIVNRSPLVIGISTDGAAPVLGQAIRARIEAMLPKGLARWTAAAKAWRDVVSGLGLSFRQRRTFWERFTVEAFAAPDREPDASLRDQLLAGGGGAQDGRGSVALVGAGPGDPDLLTLGAVRALQGADVILFDDLVSAEVLEFARREARRILVGKRGARESCSQADIQALMVSLALQGKRVVRLKSGDPMVFGRAGEEIAALREAGVAVSIIPGVTSAQALAARLSVSLTHRDVAQSVLLTTGHSRVGALPDTIDWAATARGEATTIVYMGARMAGALRRKLEALGAPPDLPAVAAASLTRPGETLWTGTLGGLDAGLARLPDGAPVLIGLGPVFRDCAAARQDAAPLESGRRMAG